MKCSLMVDLAPAACISFMGQIALAFKKPTGICVKLIKATFNILDEYPSQNDIYLREKVSGKFPIKFLETCWIEDQLVSYRTSEVWPSMVAMMKH